MGTPKLAHLTLLLLATSVLGRPLGAQAFQPADRQALVASIDSASRVRVRLSTGWATLEEPRVRGDSLQFRRGSTNTQGGRVVPVQGPLALADLLEIRVPAGHRTLRGALWGGAIGAALGLALWVGASSEDSQGLGAPTDNEAFVVVPILTAVGAGVGALLATASPRWRTIYPSK
jgi:hypothetical protein